MSLVQRVTPRQLLFVIDILITCDYMRQAHGRNKKRSPTWRASRNLSAIASDGGDYSSDSSKSRKRKRA